MGKRVGKAYDPSIRLTECGSRLYNSWRKVRKHPHCDEWNDFQTFYTWAMQNGYALGTWLRLIDESKPYCPSNCEWHLSGISYEKKSADCEWIYDWNATVNRIRKHYGMPPLEGTEYD